MIVFKQNTFLRAKYLSTAVIVLVGISSGCNLSEENERVGGVSKTGSGQNPRPEDDQRVAKVIPYLCVLSVRKDAKIEYVAASAIDDARIVQSSRLLVDGKAVATGVENGIDWLGDYEPVETMPVPTVRMLAQGGGFASDVMEVKFKFTPPANPESLAGADFDVTVSPSEGAPRWIAGKPLRSKVHLALGQWQIASFRKSHSNGDRENVFLVLAKLAEFGAGTEAKSRSEIVHTLAPGIESKHWWGAKPELEGKIVLLDFWATWCGPCVTELPKVNKLFDDSRREGLVVIGIHHQKGEKESIHNFLAENPSPHAVCWDETGAISKGFGLKEGIPHYVLIDHDGVIRWEGRWLKDALPIVELLQKTRH